MCRWLELVGELDRRGEWAERGCGSCAEWLAWRCALLPRTAREHVRVARRLPALALLRAAFAGGELSYAKVRALTRVAEPDSEQELVELARLLTAAELERAVRAYRRVTTEDANDLHANAHLSTFWDEDGSLVLQGRLAPEDGALLLRALKAARDWLWQQGRKRERGSAEPRPRPTSAEALAAVAEAALASKGGRSGGERYQVVVHVDADALASEGEFAACALDEGPALAAETARRLACDASVVGIGERKGGRCASAGRRARSRPGRRIPRVWRAPPGDPDGLLEHDHAATIGPDTCASGSAEPMDLDLTVDALLVATSPSALNIATKDL